MNNLTLLLGTTLLLINVSLVFSAGLVRPNLQVQGQNFNIDPRRLTKQLPRAGTFIPKFQGQGSFNNLNFNPASASGDALRTTNDLFNAGYHGVAKPFLNAAVKSVASIGTLPLKLLLKPGNLDHIPDEFVDKALDIGGTISDAVVGTKDNLVDANANLLDNVGAYANEAGAGLQQQADRNAALLDGYRNGFVNGVNQFQDEFLGEEDDRRSRRHSGRHSGRRHSRREEGSRRDKDSRGDRDSRRDRGSRRDRDSRRDGSSRRDRDSKSDRDSNQDKDSKRGGESKRSGSKAGGKGGDGSSVPSKDQTTPPAAGAKP